MDADEDDFVFYGTPIEREEEMTSRKKKAVADAAGQMRSLPQWKQEVTDEEGRRRFHGAFTGGFSAGYYNTAGSKEGWTPQSFTSSRKSRAEVKEQSAYNFMDDDEKAELEGSGFGTSSLFDTFGFTAADVARKQAEKELNKRPSAIPGPLPDELILPAANSIGVKLLLKMGWRHGHLIKDAQANSLYEARREARKAFLAFSSNEARPGHDQVNPSKSDYENASEEPFADEKMFLQSTPVFVLNPKQDLHGLGFDPFKHAPEFRERKRLRKSGNKGSGNRNASTLKDKLFASNSGKVAPGFGIGALEELDVEDEDIYASGFEFEETYVEEVEEPPRMARDNKLQLTNKEHGGLSGFKVASNSDFRMERFTPPVIPPNFEPHHKFIAPLEIGSRFAEPPPLEVPPPDDNNLKLLIEGFATLVSRCGKLFEDLSREKNKNNPLFSFLTGGNGHDFYTRKLWEEQQKRSDQQQKQQVDNGKAMPSMVQKKLTAESRGRILGEKPLESTKVSSSSAATNEVHLQFGLSDTFTKPSSLIELAEATRPFKDDPRKQERFEQFLKDKYRGGLRSANSGGASNMSEADRARERVDFERAAEKIEKGEWSKPSQQIMEMQPPTTGLFISGGIELYKPPNEEKIKGIKYPRREEYQWRPSSILCKRFDIADPFMGKPPPIPRPRSRMDSLIFTSDSVKPMTTYEPAPENRDSLLVSQTELQQGGEEILNKESEIIEVTPNVERPVDLYKAIFSDDSDEDDGAAPTVNRDDDADKPPEGGNTTLNRLIAGDFLESLGKELGLEVPPDPIYYSTQKTNTSQEEKQTTYSNTTSNSTRRISSYDREINAVTKDDKLSRSDNIQLGFSEGINTEKAPQSLIDKAPKSCYSEEKSGKVRTEEMAGQNRNRSEKRRHRSRSSMSSGDSSDSDRRRRDRSRYKDDRRDSSRQKSKKHSKHHKHKNKGSPSRSSRHDSDSEDDKRVRRKSRQDREDSRDKRKSKHHSSSNFRKGYHHE